MLALEDLIARLEREAGTPGTPRESAGVPTKPAQTLAGTPGTPGTLKNDDAERVSAAVALHAPPPGSLPARIIEAGGTSRIGGPRPGGGLYKTAVMPGDAPAELVAELTADNWHVLRIIEAAKRAEPRPDLDPAEWQGEYEAE